MASPALPELELLPRPAIPAARMPGRLAILLVLINLLWGGSAFAVKVAVGSPELPGVPPITLAFARFSVAALLMYAFAAPMKVDLRVARRDWGAFWAMGIFGLALTYLLVYQGARLTTATNSALLMATEPMFLAVLAFAFLREPMPMLKVVGIVAGLAGVSLIVARGWHFPRLSGLALGDLLIAAGLFFEAVSCILGKGLLARYPAVTVITYQMSCGAIALAPFAVWELIRQTLTGHPIALPSPAALFSLLYLIIPCTVIAYFIWFSILDKRGPGEMSVFLFLQPVVGALLGAWLLKEPLPPFTLVGAALILLGIVLINRRPALPPAPP